MRLSHIPPNLWRVETSPGLFLFFSRILGQPPESVRRGTFIGFARQKCMHITVVKFRVVQNNRHPLAPNGGWQLVKSWLRFLVEEVEGPKTGRGRKMHYVWSVEPGFGVCISFQQVTFCRPDDSLPDACIRFLPTGAWVKAQLKMSEVTETESQWQS